MVDAISFLLYFIILFLRFFLFDFWLKRLSDVKYFIQTSSWWPAVRSWHVVKVLNFLWMLPKRAIFDNKSEDKQESRSSYWHTRIDSSSQSHFEAEDLKLNCTTATCHSDVDGKSHVKTSHTEKDELSFDERTMTSHNFNTQFLVTYIIVIVNQHCKVLLAFHSNTNINKINVSVIDIHTCAQ